MSNYYDLYNKINELIEENEHLKRWKELYEKSPDCSKDIILSRMNEAEFIYPFIRSWREENKKLIEILKNKNEENFMLCKLLDILTSNSLENAVTNIFCDNLNCCICNGLNDNGELLVCGCEKMYDFRDCFLELLKNKKYDSCINLIYSITKEYKNDEKT